MTCRSILICALRMSILLPCAVLAAQELPITGLGHAGVMVSDIGKARAFYSGVLGFDMAFEMMQPDGKTLKLEYYKVNDMQFLEIYPHLKPDAVFHMTHVAFITSDIDRLHEMMVERGLKPGPINEGHDGNKSFAVRPPPGQQLRFLEFTEYLPGSLHSNSRGKDMPATRLSAHMQFAGIPVTDLKAALQFYRTMGFREVWHGRLAGAKGEVIDLQLPGKSKDYIELVDEPAPELSIGLVVGQYFGFAVPRILSTYKKAVSRSAKVLGPPDRGPDGKLEFGVLDPDGTLVEFRAGAPTK